MFKFLVTLSVTSFIVTVYAVIYDKKSLSSLQETRKILNELGPSQALPVVLILENIVEPPGEKLSTPDDIIQAEVERGRMFSGTKFSLMGLEKQLFFCPEGNAQEQCLAPKNFGHSKLLQCDVQPTPDVFQDYDPKTCRCGIDGTGIYHMVHFLLCPAKEPYRYGSTFLGIYEFCYNRQIEQVLFTVHSILSPKLVQHELFLLHREHELRYPYEYDRRYPISSHYVLNWGLHSLLYTTYVKQYLVPIEDMPFGIWKKTINKSYNSELQHARLFRFWDEINKKVREEALFWDNLDDSVRAKLLVRTGVFKINVDMPVSVNQMYNRWVKMVSTMRNNKELAGVVILMNNFVNDPNEIGDNEFKSLKDEMEQLCPENLCNNMFRNRFDDYGAWVQCCRVTPEIMKLFGLQKTLSYLKIRNLTV